MATDHSSSKEKDAAKSWSRGKKLALGLVFAAAVAGGIVKTVETVIDLRQENLVHHRQLPTI